MPWGTFKVAGTTCVAALCKEKKSKIVSWFIKLFFFSDSRFDGSMTRDNCAFQFFGEIIDNLMNKPLKCLPEWQRGTLEGKWAEAKNGSHKKKWLKKSNQINTAVMYCHVNQWINWSTKYHARMKCMSIINTYVQKSYLALFNCICAVYM